jgi:hypothetical protein
MSWGWEGLVVLAYVIYFEYEIYEFMLVNAVLNRYM